MPVGHRRFNNPNADPNDNITFIRVLEDYPDSDQAQKILDALAAQFKPIMKQWGFGVNSLVEHEWNPTFAGRNWNAGEVVEIVLRRRDGTFAPYQFLLYVMCHELAHIREMNHSWAFKAVNTQLRQALTALRAKNYFGDGFWSSGHSLQYATATAPLAPEDEPTFTCGGANRKRRRRRAPTGPAGPSKPRGEPVAPGATGRQTRVPPKAGGRVTRKRAFPEEGGQVLSTDPEQSSYKRRAQAKDAKAARAAAAEARLAAERRAKAAEARAAGGPPSGKKEEEDNDEAEEGWSAGGGETDEEDKPEVVLEEGEKRFLEEDMRAWRRAFGEEPEDGDVKPRVGEDEGKGKGKAKPAKRRASPNPAPGPARGPAQTKAADADDPLDALDLTPAERAWLAADAAPGEGDGDGVERAGKKVRVAYMPMPASMGGTGGGKASTSKHRFDTCPDSDDDDLVICDSVADDIERPALRKPQPPPQPQPHSPARKPPRKPMKFFAHGAPAQPALGDLLPTSSAPAAAKREKPVSARRGAAGKDNGKGKGMAAPESSDDEAPAPQAKKIRKVRSDGGVKRGARKKVAQAGKGSSSSSGEEEEVAVDALERIRRERQRDDHELEWTEEERVAVRRAPPKKQKLTAEGGKAVVVGLDLRAVPRASTSTAPGAAPASPPPLSALIKGKSTSRAPLQAPLAPDSGAYGNRGSPATDASSICSLPSSLFPSPTPSSPTRSFLTLPLSEQSRAIVHLDAQAGNNARLAEKRAKRKEEEGRREDAKRRIEARMEEVQREAERRPAEGSAKPVGWGRNVSAEAVATHPSGAKGGGEAALMEEHERAGRQWRCSLCDFDNAAVLPLCEMCEAGARTDCIGWSLAA